MELSKHLCDTPKRFRIATHLPIHSHSHAYLPMLGDASPIGCNLGFSVLPTDTYEPTQPFDHQFAAHNTDWATIVFETNLCGFSKAVFQNKQDKVLTGHFKLVQWSITWAKHHDLFADPLLHLTFSCHSFMKVKHECSLRQQNGVSQRFIMVFFISGIFVWGLLWRGHLFFPSKVVFLGGKSWQQSKAVPCSLVRNAALCSWHQSTVSLAKPCILIKRGKPADGKAGH